MVGQMVDLTAVLMADSWVDLMVDYWVGQWAALTVDQKAGR